MDKDKQKAIDIVIANMEKQFGKGSIMSGDSAPLPDVEFNSTSSISLDKALGGGFAKGRIIEIYGPESSGKTTLVLQAIAQCQKIGGVCAFIDMEHALDPRYATALGVRVGDLLISQPECAEEALEIAEALVRSNAVDIIAVDSVAALVPRAELEGDMGANHPGLQARLMSQALRKLTGAVHESGTTFIFTNQIRYKIGVMYGNPEVTSGGNGLKFYASQRLDVRGHAKNKDNGGTTFSVTTTVKIVKNKVAPPFREVEFDIEFGKGINKYTDLIDYASNHGQLEKAGSWFVINGEKLQGVDNVVNYLTEHQDYYEELYAKCQKT